MADDRFNMSLGPRLRQRAFDNTTGSYPTTSRTGDSRRGNLPVRFDDRNTLIFTDDITAGLEGADPIDFVQPQVDELTAFNDAQHIEQSKRDGNIEFFETGSRIEDVGIGFDAPLRSKTKIVINLDMPEPSPLGITNQPSSSLDRNKRQHFMGYYNFDRKQFEGVGYGYDVSGNELVLGSSEAAQNSFALKWNTVPIGFSPSQAFFGRLQDASFNDAKQDPNFFKGICRPMSNYGFPIHQKFHATSSQLFDVGSVIDRPFLLEKIVYEFSASYEESDFSNPHSVIRLNIDTDSGINTSQHTAIATFFILNQRRPFSANQVIPTTMRRGNVFGHTSASIILPGKYQLTSGTVADPAPFTYVDTGRDLVTYSQLLLYREGNSTDESAQPIDEMIEAGLGRDLNVRLPGAISSNPTTFTGSFVLSGTVRQDPLITQANSWNDTVLPNAGGEIVDVRWDPGTRNNLDMVSTGRDLVASVGGDVPSTGSYYLSLGFGALPRSNPFTAGTNVEINSPYLLKPGDKLVFGWEAPWSRVIRFMDPPPPSTVQRYTILPGRGKLTLYGSQVKEGVEFHDTLNQPLTTLSVHEDIHADNPVIDQFDTEPKEQFSGSYISEFITGTLSNLPSSRGRATSAAISGAFEPFLTRDHEASRSTVRGFLRGTQLTSDAERFFDSMMPRIDAIARANGVSITTDTAADPRAFIKVGPRPASDPADVTTSDETWNRAFPFEPKYAGINRSIVPQKRATITHLAGSGAETPIRDGNIVLLRVIPGGSVTILDDTDGTFSDDDVATGETLLIDYFGIGDYTPFTGSVGYRSQDAVIGVDPIKIPAGPKPRGFKYGVLNARAQFAKAVFTNGSFGQLRDLLEQRLDAKYYDPIGVQSDGSPARTGVRSSPVQVRFMKACTNQITDPYLTFGSNMSIEATSSLPYFDGFDRNRQLNQEQEENIDITIEPMLTPIDIVQKVIPEIELPPIVQKRVIPPTKTIKKKTKVLAAISLTKVKPLSPIVTSTAVPVFAAAKNLKVSLMGTKFSQLAQLVQIKKPF